MLGFNPFWSSAPWTLLFIGVALAAPATPPKVKLGNATFVGKYDGDTEKFLGIRYAQGPRYELPVPITTYESKSYDASNAGFSCPQLQLGIAVALNWATEAAKLITEWKFDSAPENEDCLNLDITRPVGTSANSKLPILVWIYGGGFTWGSTDQWLYDGEPLVELSAKEKQPMIMVAMNYRLGGWGFLDSKEVRDGGIGNLGLQDQREALRWIQRNIAAFGGDPSRVTIWGESSGAMSIGLHMVANGGNTEGLFHGAFLQSGAIIPIGNGPGGQPEYDTLVRLMGCQDQSNKLDCLRKVPFEKLNKVLGKRGTDFNDTSSAPAWIPRVDGLFLKEAPMDAVANGRMAGVPMIIGNTADEGSYFARSFPSDVKDTAAFKSHIEKNWFPNATPQEVQRVLELYPESRNQTAEGVAEASDPEASDDSQFRRLSLFLGDALLHAPRRWMSEHVQKEQKVWVYNNAQWRRVPVLGATHASDVFHMFKGGEMQKYLVNFVNNQNPNTPPKRKQSDIIPWPQYDSGQKNQLEVTDGLFVEDLRLTTDTYRPGEIAFLQTLLQKYPRR